MENLIHYALVELHDHFPFCKSEVRAVINLQS